VNLRNHGSRGHGKAWKGEGDLLLWWILQVGTGELERGVAFMWLLTQGRGYYRGHRLEKGLTLAHVPVKALYPNSLRRLVYSTSRQRMIPDDAHTSNQVSTVLLTLAAERQVRDFLIGPRNKKQRKKRSTSKILHPPFQITSRDF
jgi:hypothetical protein